MHFAHGYALLVGVGQTAYSRWSLPTTVKDARAIKAILTNPALCGYLDDPQHIRLLHDETATQANIRDGLRWLAEQAARDAEATIVLYYSGHGWLDETNKRYYLIPHDADPLDRASSFLPEQDVTALLRAIQARKLLVMLDCCHAEGMAAAKTGASASKLPTGFKLVAPPDVLLEELKQGAGRAVFSSSRGDQSSWVRPDGTLSIYTYHLLEALQGAGNQPGDSTVCLSNLIDHLSKAVPASAQQLCQAEQKPFFEMATENFPIALLHGGKGLSSGGWQAAEAEAAARIRVIVQAIGQGSVAIGGDVGSGSIINTGTLNQSTTNTGGGAFVGGNVNTGGGDFVGRDKMITRREDEDADTGRD